MYEWPRLIQTMVDEIDESLRRHDSHGCELDMTAGRVMYFYFDPGQYFKCIHPIHRK